MKRRSAEQLPASGRVVALAVLSIIPSWFLGVEQIVPGCVLIFGTAALVRQGRLRINIPTVLLGGLWFLGWVSVLAVRLDGLGWVIFLRAQFTLVVAAAAFNLVAVIESIGDLSVVFRAVAVVSCTIFLVAILVTSGLVPLEFRSPVAHLLGSRLPTSPVLEERILRRVAGVDWGRYIRPTVFFLYANFFASGLVAMGFVGLVGTQWRRRGAIHILFWCGFVAACGGIILTRGRAAALAVVAGLMAWLGGRVIVRRWGMRGLGWAALVAALAMSVALRVPIGGRSSLERALLDVRVNSVVNRLAVYQATLRAIERRPMVGFGIRQSSHQINSESTGLRLGSHSDLLNVAYRFGFLGLIVYLAIGVEVFRRWRRRARFCVRSGESRTPSRRLWLALGSGLIAVAVNALFIDLQFDVNAYWLSWILAGMVYAPAIRHETRKEVERAKRPTTGANGTVPGAMMISEARDGTVRERRIPPTWRCVGLGFQLWTMEELTQAVVKCGAGRGEPIIVGYLNLHGAALAQRQPRLSAFYGCADLVHLDGMVMTWIVRLLGVPARRKHRITYADWTTPLITEAARNRRSIFFLGSQLEVVEVAMARLRTQFPGLHLGFHHGYFDSRPGSQADARVVELIREFDPDILVVGMGMPRQEEWILDHAGELRAGVILAAGACMDYIAGRVKTPPRWAGQIGLEWLFRLIQEPRRLLSRYLVEPWSLVWPVLRELPGRSRREPVSLSDTASPENLVDDER